MAATIEDVRRIALALPDVIEGVCYGTPAFYLRGKLMLRLREDFETLVVKLPLEQRAELIEAEPDIFSVTDHYRNYPVVLMSLPSVSLAEMHRRIEGAWQMLASRKQIAARSAAKPSAKTTSGTRPRKP